MKLKILIFSIIQLISICAFAINVKIEKPYLDYNAKDQNGQSAIGVHCQLSVSGIKGQDIELVTMVKDGNGQWLKGKNGNLVKGTYKERVRFEPAIWKDVWVYLPNNNWPEVKGLHSGKIYIWVYYAGQWYGGVDAGNVVYGEAERSTNKNVSSQTSTASQNSYLTYKAKAEKGDAYAMLMLGNCYFGGSHGATKNMEEAFKWYQKSSYAGNANAMRHLGVMYWNGQGVAKNISFARYWLDKAVKNGYSDAFSLRDKADKYLAIEKSKQTKTTSNQYASNNSNNRITTNNTSFSTAPQKEIEIRNVYVEQNVLRNDKFYHAIHANIIVRNNKGKNMTARAYFLDENGQRLDDINGSYRDPNGYVCVSKSERCLHSKNETEWKDFVLYIPTKEVHAKKGTHRYTVDFRVKVDGRDNWTKSQMAPAFSMTENQYYTSCWRCKGKKVIECVYCNGKGEVRRQLGYNRWGAPLYSPFPTNCSHCRGNKTVSCPTCQGEGMVALNSNSTQPTTNSSSSYNQNHNTTVNTTKKKEEIRRRYVTCSFCNGTGLKYDMDWLGSVTIHCSKCGQNHSDGAIHKKCDKCEGFGQIPQIWIPSSNKWCDENGLAGQWYLNSLKE